MNYNQNSGYGQALLNMVSSQVPTFGRIFVVLDKDDTDEETYQRMQEVFTPVKGVNRFFKTVAEAYAAVESNNNDVILLDANSSHVLTSVLNVSKNRVHFIGMDGGGRLNSQGTKIQIATAVATDIAVINNSGTRNTFMNLKMIQAGTDVACTSAFIDTGEGTYMKNCQLEVNTILSTATQALLFKGDTCHYEDCQIGNSTVYHTAANQAPLVIQTPARYSYFVNCEIINYSSQTSASIIDLPDTDSVIGWVKFNNCALTCALKGNGATAGGAAAEGITNACTSGYVLLDNRCTSFNCDITAEAVAYTLLAAPDGGTATKGGEAIPCA